MENAMVRTRTTRRPVQNRHRRKTPGTAAGLGPLIARQLLISLLLLIIICIAKNINFSAAKVVTDQVKYVISHNVELKNVFDYMGKLAAEVKNSISPATTGKPGVTEPQISETAQASIKTPASESAVTSSSALTSSSPQTSSSALTSNTATLSSMVSAESSIDDKEVQKEEVNTDMETMAETSVLSANSAIESEDPAGMLLPVEGTLISRFGEKSGDAAGTGKIHEGIDLSASGSTEVKAALDGKVTDTGSSPAYGRYIRLLHADGLQTIYANCSGLIASKGNIVKKGDVIAEIGGIGASVGVHLHFEVWKDGTAVDPLEYVSVPGN